MRTCQTSDSNYDNSSDESCNSSRRGDDDEVLDNNDPFPKKKTRSPPRFRYHDFFPMYLTFFKDLGTTLPFLDFHLNVPKLWEMEVLEKLYRFCRKPLRAIGVDPSHDKILEVARSVMDFAQYMGFPFFCRLSVSH